MAKAKIAPHPHPTKSESIKKARFSRVFTKFLWDATDFKFQKRDDKQGAGPARRSSHRLGLDTGAATNEYGRTRDLNNRAGKYDIRRMANLICSGKVLTKTTRTPASQPQVVCCFDSAALAAAKAHGSG